MLWPRYFDAKLSRAQGRRVPKDLAVKEPDAKWVHSAATKAGLDATLEEKPRDPFRAWKKPGRVVIQGKGGKEATLRKVAAQMQS